MDETIHTRLERERKASQPQAALLRTYRDYARGVQVGTLTTAQRAILRGVVKHQFADNVCKMVLLAATGRLQLARFEVSAKPVEAWLRDWWTTAGLPTLQGQVHWAALRDGNHAVALSWEAEPGRVRLARERWWDGKQGIWIAYDDSDQPSYAVKEWETPEGRRRVFWWPDRIERYLAVDAGWQPYRLDPTNPGSWRDAWVDRDGQPLGLPVVHFRNAYLPQDADETDSNYGVSELDGGVLGLQDEVNDVQRDLTSGARYTGYQMLYATGVTPDTDPVTGERKPLRVEPGAVFESENDAARFGPIPAGDLSQLERTLQIKLQAVSRQTATPLHLITGGDWPSGEALLRADKPLVNKVLAMGRVFGPAWASLAHKATVLANTFGKPGQPLDTDALITAVFASPEDSDPLTLAQVADAIAPFVSEQEVLRVLNYGPDAQQQILKERKADKKANTPAPAVPNPPPDGQPAPADGQTQPGAQSAAPTQQEGQ